MLWKIAKAINLPFILNPTSLSRPAKWSLIWQLTFIYTISAFIVFLAATIFLYWIFNTQFEIENYQILKNELLILEKLLQTHSLKSPILKEEITVESPLEHYYSRIIDASTGKIVFETPEMNIKVPVSAFSKIMSSKQKYYLSANFISPKRKPEKKKNYLLMATKISNIPNLYIQIAMDVTEQKKVLEDYREDLFLVLIMGVIGSAIVGIFVTKKSIKPLREITESTQKITIARLQERLNSSSWPKELSQLAVAFNEMLDRIEEGFMRISQFASDLAHEFRTPIATLIGEAEIILSKPRSNDEYREVLESSLDEFSRLSSTIENLLFLARAENPAVDIKFQSINVRKIMDDIRDFYAIFAEEKNINIMCYGEIMLMAEPLMLRRALGNVVSNALRYTSAGGSITICAKFLSNNEAVVSISDTGEGMASEHLPHLCRRFYRVDPARNYRTGGTGLGLAIVKSIMDLHKGKIIIESKQNVGTTVNLIFCQYF